MAQSMPLAKTSKRGANDVSFWARTWSDIATARYKSCASAKRLNDISLSASLTTRLEIILGMVDWAWPIHEAMTMKSVVTAPRVQVV